MIFVPVYRSLDHREPELPNPVPKHKQHLSPQQLRDELKIYGRLNGLHGLLFGGINVEAFIQHQFPLETNAPVVTFALYALTNPTQRELPEQLLFDSRLRPSKRAQTQTGPDPRIGNQESKIENDRASLAAPPVLRDVSIYGRVLRFVLEPGPAFASAMNLRTLGIAGGFGVATTLLLSGFIAYQARANRKEREISAALRASEARLQTILHERERMSRDLHDGTIQSLYAIGLGLGRLRRSLSGPAEKERLDGSLAELDHVVAELRSYLVVLDPGVSPAQSAATALSELVARLRQTTAMELHFTADPGAGDGWPPAAVLDLLQVAREGVSNALRHGQAPEVELALRQAGQGEMHFTIVDHGRGFDPSAARPNGSHGLANLERRARAWNGWLRVESRPGGPTRLTLALFPLGGQSHASAPPLREVGSPNADKNAPSRGSV